MISGESDNEEVSDEEERIWVAIICWGVRRAGPKARKTDSIKTGTGLEGNEDDDDEAVVELKLPLERCDDIAKRLAGGAERS